MYSKLKYIFPLLLVVFLFFVKSQVEARSGCCSQHDGVCGCGCCDGTPLSSTCAPYYPNCGGGSNYVPTKTYIDTLPVCIKPDLSAVKGTSFVTEVDCKQNVVFTWDKGIGDNQYRIALSKTAGADSGPTADTTTRTMSFSDVKPGKWYVNIKAGNSCGWSNVQYWDIEVPQPNVQINRFSASKRDDGMSELRFDAKCGVGYSISPSVGNLTQAQINQGYVAVKPSEDTTYTLTVTGNGQTRKSTVSVLAPTPTPEPTPSPTPDSSIQEEENLELIEKEKTDLNQNDSSFWNNLFSNSVVSTIFRVLILKF